MKTIDDICKVYKIDLEDKESINKFEKCFDALYDLNEYIRKTMEVDNIEIVILNPCGYLLIIIQSSKYDTDKDIENEIDGLFKCCKYFYYKYDLEITKDIYIDTSRLFTSS